MIDSDFNFGFSFLECFFRRFCVHNRNLTSQPTFYINSHVWPFRRPAHVSSFVNHKYLTLERSSDFHLLRQPPNRRLINRGYRSFHEIKRIFFFLTLQNLISWFSSFIYSKFQLLSILPLKIFLQTYCMCELWYNNILGIYFDSEHDLIFEIYY